MSNQQPQANFNMDPIPAEGESKDTPQQHRGFFYRLGQILAYILVAVIAVGLTVLVILLMVAAIICVYDYIRTAL